MKPKRVIILIDSDELRRSVTALVLDAHRYRVVRAANASAAHLVCPERADCVLAFQQNAAVQATNLARRCYAKSVVVAEKAESIPEEQYADVWLLKGQCAMENVLRELKTACYRKRGPHSAAAVEAAMKAVAA